ncbi:MAG: type III pantothenate kinase [Burkholderiales bacterium]|nr:type III pantothenate kinase [Burkholderiales bacterium]
MLLIDIGNTFLKWGVFRPSAAGTARDNRVASGHALLEEIPTLRRPLARLPTPASIVISNVAGTRARSAAIRMLETWSDAPAPYWLVPQDAQCGVTNRYRDPAQLGSDRWAALIGTRHLLGARPAMVVVCGTATTIDFLTADGVFKGGAILPGVGLMLRSLNEGTAALPDQGGEFADYPTRTVDAIASGCQHAQAGAIERLFAHERQTTPDVTCLLSGGAAPAVAPRLTIPYTAHENVVLEGLYAIGMSLHTEALHRRANPANAERDATLP